MQGTAKAIPLCFEAKVEIRNMTFVPRAEGCEAHTPYIEQQYRP
jgi:hypothetical protein